LLVNPVRNSTEFGMRILFDIGGTKMRLAATKDCKNFGEPKIVQTPKNFKEGIEVFKKLALELSGGEKIKMAGGGVTGPFDSEKTKIIKSPNLPDWAGKPLKKEMEQGLGAPVYIENDTAIVGLGEAHNGAGKGYGIVVYMTVSTGVGGVRIVDGYIDKNTFGFEPGHQIIDMSGSVCETCNVLGSHSDGPGHLEGYVSGTATERRFGKKAYEVKDEKVWDELAHWLAYGLNNTIVHWSPDVVVLGGSMIVGDPAIEVAVVESYLKKIITIFPELPRIKKAELEDIGGLYGALAFVKQHIS
jgi:predicted NBD/HSP70 family sugar kinase